jgi:probable rRNA maturation factor
LKVERQHAKAEATDAVVAPLVSSFRSPVLKSPSSTPWEEFEGFWGDVVISAETARRNARREGHSTESEIRWLILHGFLHLLGYDHEQDGGIMAALELSLRARLDVD